MKPIWLWIREDGQQPKAIARGTRPPGPGSVVEVQASTSNEARAVYVASLAKVSVEEDPHAFATWYAAQARVRVVDLAKEVK